MCKHQKYKEKLPKFVKSTIIIYCVMLSLSLIIAYFSGFYYGLGDIETKQYSYLYIMYFITFIFIYFIQYLILQFANDIFLSNKIFRILIYFIAFVISIFTYGILPLTNLGILKSHITVWNNTLTTLIIFDVLFFFIFSKKND